MSGGASDRPPQSSSHDGAAMESDADPRPFLQPFFDSAADDPDQELSPTPPTKASPSADADADAAYDLWGSWSVRSFRSSAGERASLSSPPLSGSADWRAFRSLSIDEAPASPPLSLSEDQETASLHSISKSLRSLSYASNGDDGELPSEKRAIRPRSFSDYTSLGSVKLHDIWNERVPQLSVPTPKPSTGEELFRSMKTTVASRHVIVRNHTGAISPSHLRRVVEALSGYGPVASIREEFASDGILFCTYFQLKAAIGAVKLWFTNSSSRAGGGETSAHFSVPYEVPNEINCATLLVQVHGPALVGSYSDMRQLCSRYGEVASVLERDPDAMGSIPYLVEFNDSRDVATAISRLAGVLLPSGHMITATRSHPPTFEIAKVQAFQDGVAAVSGQLQPSYTNRPKSFSESTSILTSPSSTSSSSPLHGSIFESRSSSFRQAADLEELTADSASETNASSSSTSPFTSSLGLGGNTWRVREPARPRSSSAFASLSHDGSSGLFADAPVSAPSRSSRLYSTQYRPPTSAPSSMSQTHQTLNHHAVMQARLGPIRSGSDPGFRNSYAASTTSSTSSVGRNDQGTGEFSLSIDKVVAGEDKRTTLMVRNIPNKYTQQMLLAEINVNHHGKYDFFYLPIDFKNKCNMGYAFINFIDASSIVSFYQEFDSQKWTNFNSEKVCAISYARLQGKQAMITRFQNSSLLEKHESYRPLVFFSSGPNQGKPEPFPSPKPQPAQHQQHSYAAKKSHHQHHHPSSHPQMAHPQMMNASDEYYIAAHNGRMFAQQQHQQLHHAANVLHSHALLANAHAAAAAMLHNMPAMGMPQTQYAAMRNPHYGQPYAHQPSGDRRYGQPYANAMPSRSASQGSFGAGFPPPTQS